MRPEQVAVVDSSAVGSEGIENLVSGPGSLRRFRVPVPLVDSAEDVGFESGDAAVRSDEPRGWSAHRTTRSTRFIRDELAGPKCKCY